MNRRDILTAAGLAALASFPVQLSAQSTPAASRCAFMEEREGAFVLEGSGSLLTEPFAIDPKRYRLEVEIETPVQGRDAMVGRFYLRTTGDLADSFSTTSDDRGFSTSIDLRDGDEYVFESSMVDGDWKIVLSPI